MNDGLAPSEPQAVLRLVPPQLIFRVSGNLLGLVFGWAAVAKAAAILDFERALSASGLLAAAWIRPAAFFVILLEGWLALANVVPALWRLAVVPSLLVTSGFVGYGLLRLIWGIQVPCNCLGPLFNMTPVQSLCLATASFALAMLARERSG